MVMKRKVPGTKGFSSVPDAIVGDARLNFAQKLIWCVVWSSWNRDTGMGLSQRRVAEKIGCSKIYVEKSVKALEKLGWLTMTPKGQGVQYAFPEDRLYEGLDKYVLDMDDSNISEVEPNEEKANERGRVKSSPYSPNKVCDLTPAEWINWWNASKPKCAKAIRVLDPKRHWKPLALAERIAADQGYCLIDVLRDVCVNPLSDFHEQWGKVSLGWLLSSSGKLAAFMNGDMSQEKQDSRDSGSLADQWGR